MYISIVPLIPYVITKYILSVRFPQKSQA